MKHLLYRQFFHAGFIALTAAICLAQPKEAEPKKTLAAEVNKTQITRQQLDHETQFHLSGEAHDFNDRERHEIERQVLDQLIARELLFQAAESTNLLPSPAEYKQVVEQAKSGFHSDSEFQQQLAGNNLDEKQFLLGLKKDLAIRNYLDNSVYASVAVSDDEVRQAFQSFPIAEEVQARQIFFRVADSSTPEQRKEILDKANLVLTELQTDRSKFAALAKQYSDGPTRAKGGDLGFFTHNQMPKDFADAAFALQPGQLSEVVQTSAGYHIILVEGRRGKDENFSDAAKHQIHDRLIAEKKERALAERLAELRKKARVVLYFD